MAKVLLDVSDVADHRQRCLDSTVGVRPANKGRRHPADRFKGEEIVAVMRQAGEADPKGAATLAPTMCPDRVESGQMRRG